MFCDEKFSNQLIESNNISKIPGKIQGSENCSDILLFHVPFTTDSRNLPSAPQLANYLVPGRQIQVVMRTVVDTVENDTFYIGWGMTIISFKYAISANSLAPAIRDAHNGWVQDADAIPPIYSE